MENEYLEKWKLLCETGLSEKSEDILEIIEEYEFEILSDMDEWSWCYHNDYYGAMLFYSMAEDMLILYDIEDDKPISELSGSDLNKVNLVRLMEDMMVLLG
jgi:hypothetical protein